VRSALIAAMRNCAKTTTRKAWARLRSARGQCPVRRSATAPTRGHGEAHARAGFSLTWQASLRKHIGCINHLQREHSMKKAQLLGVSICMAFAALSTGAQAGCLKGAAAGAVGGHFLGHHGGIGAVAGCAAGHMHAKHKLQREQLTRR
jgi:hypothetical protein